MLNVLAVIAISLEVISVLIMPALIGEEREPYTYYSWIGQVISAVIVIALALRVLNFI